MKLYIDTKLMEFEEDNIEHEIILGVYFEKGICEVTEIELPNDDRFIKDTLKIEYTKDEKGKETDKIEKQYFVVREQNTWWSFPLYELRKNKIVKFNWENYSYFSGTDRRVALSAKINKIYNKSSEAKILRKTLKYIMDTLNIEYPDNFKRYNTKVEKIIVKNPKEK